MRIASQMLYAMLFQIGWFLCVCLGNPWASGFALAFALFHLVYIGALRSGARLAREGSWLLLIAIAGFAMETLFFSAGLLYHHTAAGFFTHFYWAPAWLFALWVCFAIALRTCFAFVFRHPILGYAIFALTVPASYVAGTYLTGDVHINKPYPLSLSLITLSWILFMGVLQQLRHSYFEDMFNDR